MAKNFVSNKDESARIFQSDFLEAFSRVHWTTPLVIFVPVIVALFYFAARDLHTGIGTMFLLFLAGIAVWTIVEYLLHRFVFHFHPKSEKMQRFFWTFHGVHHDYPQDSKRLVMVPAISIPLAVIFYLLFDWLLPENYIYAFFPGFIAGYLFYDITHYAIHHFGFKNKFWLKLKQYHMKHHYRHPDYGYGVSSPFWDKVFRTEFPKK